MKIRSIAFIAVAVLLANAVGIARTDNKAAEARRQTARIVNLLPASDAVVAFDAKHTLNDALPKILAANPAMLSQISTKILEAETKTGIDFRKFDQVAVGVQYVQTAAGKTEYEPVVIATGDINAGALVAVAKLASNGSYRTDTINGKTVYVFSTKTVVQKASPVTVNNSKLAASIDNAIDSVVRDVVVASLDSNTLVVGSLARVKETLDGKTHVSSDLTSLLATGSTVAAFAARMPNGLGSLLPLDNDELGQTLQSIQYVWGSFDANANGAEVIVNARTKTAQQATSLKDTLDGLSMLGRMALGNGNTPDKQVLGRMIRNVHVDAHAADVTVSLTVPQPDIDILVAKIK